MKEVDVIIVGAGPTGLMAANQLERWGVKYALLDKKSGPTKESRALAVSARSMELYQQLGLANEILERAVPLQGFIIFDGEKKKAEVGFKSFGGKLSKFNDLMVVYEQSKNESTLYSNLKQKKSVFWNTEFISLSQDDSHIHVKAQGAQALNIKAKYLIAADGASSPIRHQLNFSFKGGTYENKFFVVDAILETKLSHNKIILAPNAKNFLALFPMEGEKNYRIIGSLSDEYSDKNDIDYDKDILPIINNSKLEFNILSHNWVSVYKLHHRCVDRFRDQRVFLAGDSAHIHSPAGGQGMNTGLQDAHNICWKIAYVLKGFADDKILDSYNEERLPFAKWLLGFTDRGFSFMSSDSILVNMFRKYILFNIVESVLNRKSIKLRAYKTISQIWYSLAGYQLNIQDSNQDLKFKAGDRFPYTSEDLYDQFGHGGFTLIHVAKELLVELDVKRLMDSFPFPIRIVEQQLELDWNDLGVKKELFVLVRPDMYIGMISDTMSGDAISKFNRNFKS